MLKRYKESVAALAVVVMVLVVLALPYAITEAYGLKARKLVLLMRLVVLAVTVGLLIWSLVRDRQTSHDIDMLREEIERNRLLRVKLRTPRTRERTQKGRDK
jgi:hypothetical protein